MLQAAHKSGYGAQFGGKYFALDVRIVRLPRHGASCPVGMGVSCSADRNIKAKINRDGIWLEQLEREPGRLIPEEYRGKVASNVVRVDLNRPMKEILAQLTKYPVTTQLSLNGTMIVARDIAHAKLKERLDKGEGLPQYLKDHPIYYAGPAKTPTGMPSGSFGPTTAGRMDSYVDLFQSHGGSMITLAKGNRSAQVTEACKEIRWLLPRIHRRPGGDTGKGKHQKGRTARVSGTRYGSDLEDRTWRIFRRLSWSTIRATTSSGRSARKPRS